MGNFEHLNEKNDGEQPRCECCGYLVTQREHFGCLHAHPAQLKEAINALNNILEYFRSGNSVAVHQATIRADSPEIVKAFDVLAKLKCGAV